MSRFFLSLRDAYDWKRCHLSAKTAAHRPHYLDLTPVIFRLGVTAHELGRRLEDFGNARHPHSKVARKAITSYGIMAVVAVSSQCLRVVRRHRRRPGALVHLVRCLSLSLFPSTGRCQSSVRFNWVRTFDAPPPSLACHFTQ